MLYAGGLLGAVLVLLWLFCIIDVIMTPDGECRYLPKLLWLGIVVLLSTLGAVVWLLAGRPWPNGSPLERLGGGGRTGGTGRTGAYERATPTYPEYDRPGRFAAGNADDDDAFLAQVRARAEAQRRAHAEQRRERDHADRAARERRQQARRERHDTNDGGDPPGGHDRDGAAG